MTDQNFVIELDDDTEGHALHRGIVEPDDSQWLEEKLRRDSGKTSFRISVLDDDDTEGHVLRGGPVVRVMLDDEDDTEGHAIAIHFPSRADADAFRRRLMVTGVLVGTVALGAAGGVGLSALQSDTGADAGAATTQSQAYAAYQEAAANEGARQGAADAEARAYANYQEAAANEGVRQGGGTVGAQVGPLDAHEAPAFQEGGLSAADQAYADRLSGQATQVGPLDAHEAPAFQSSASTVDADRDIGIMDGSGAAAGTQVGPLDAHEAPAFQSETTDEGSSELNDIGGPTPR
jgi:hypothetical protein